MKKKPIYLRRVGMAAIHEAGHLLIALRECRSFDEIAIAGSPNLRGLEVDLMNCRYGDAAARTALGAIVAKRLCLPRWEEWLCESAHYALGVVANCHREREGDVNKILKSNLQATITALLESWGTFEDLAMLMFYEKPISHRLWVAINDREAHASQPPYPLQEHDAAWDVLMDRVRQRMRHPDTTDEEEWQAYKSRPSKLVMAAREERLRTALRAIEKERPQVQQPSLSEEAKIEHLSQWAGRRTLH